MGGRLRNRLLFAAILLLPALKPWAVAMPAGGEEIAIVVSEKNPVSDLSVAELKKILSGQKHAWPNGTAIRLFVRAAGASERVALLKLLGMTENEYKQYWRTLMFRGDAATEPVALYSNSMQREAVLSFPGAIVLVSVRDVKDGEKILRINGRMPGESGYPIP
jgi:ABC-type phosphate transport system substrate-binding protein